VRIYLPHGHIREHRSVLYGQNPVEQQLVGKLPQTSADDVAARIYRLCKKQQKNNKKH